MTFTTTWGAERQMVILGLHGKWIIFQMLLTLFKHLELEPLLDGFLRTRKPPLEDLVFNFLSGSSPGAREEARKQRWVVEEDADSGDEALGVLSSLGRSMSTWASVVATWLEKERKAQAFDPL